MRVVSQLEFSRFRRKQLVRGLPAFDACQAASAFSLLIEGFQKGFERNCCSGDQALQSPSGDRGMLRDRKRRDLARLGQNDVAALLAGNFPAESLKRPHDLARPQNGNRRH